MKDLSNIGAERHEAGCGQSVWRTTVAILCFYVFAGLFNGAALQKDLELLPYGTKRDVCLALIRPVAWLSQQTHAADLRAGLERLIHKEQKK